MERVTFPPVSCRAVAVPSNRGSNVEGGEEAGGAGEEEKDDGDDEDDTEEEEEGDNAGKDDNGDAASPLSSLPCSLWSPLRPIDGRSCCASAAATFPESPPHRVPPGAEHGLI